MEKHMIKELVMHQGCKKCSLARKEWLDKKHNLCIIQEQCRFGGKVTVEEGQDIQYSCHQ